MNYCELKAIGDAAYTAFDVTVSISDYEENFNVVDGSNAGRSLATARMIRDVKGAFFGHKITFFRNGMSPAAVRAFDDLWDWIKRHSVDDYVFIRAADGQASISYEAYYTSGSRKLKAVENGVNYWDELTVNFIPMAPQLTP